MRTAFEFLVAFVWAVFGVELLYYLKDRYGTEDLTYLLISALVWVAVFVYLSIADPFLKKMKKGIKKDIVSTFVFAFPSVSGLVFLYLV